MSLELISVQCPYCGEVIDVELEPQAEDFIQDCSVCCRPIQFNVEDGDEGPAVTASRTE